jgi:hypothetical protein
LLGEFKTAMNVLAHAERRRSTCPFSYRHEFTAHDHALPQIDRPPDTKFKKSAPQKVGGPILESLKR